LLVYPIFSGIFISLVSVSIPLRSPPDSVTTTAQLKKILACQTQFNAPATVTLSFILEVLQCKIFL